MDKLPPEAIAALQRGSLIEAIKIVRDKTGLDLKSAKEAVERHANGQGAPADWQEGDWGRGEPEGAGMQGNGPAAVPSAALMALAKGNKVEAVRLTREATGLGLAEAKRLVENHQNPAAGDFGHLPSNMPTNPMAEPGRVPQGGFKWLPIVIVVLVVVLAWLYFTKGA
ncbi:ribosomal protein L7/L12 [Variovorax boronicumulans]|uniref:ribosomal protein L7/L12 n=1 Tax=Variovorax boronicumulans TaxID=436515 RepID=UPI002476B77F|nr:ribosomal protein L7/L12 [Variovorax boronicumulans]MDH6165255.1 ribosomal protein L7/L12 [Variovorax boronicumulans]